MRAALLAITLLGCWSEPAKPTTPPASPAKPTVVPADAATVAGCNDAHECKLRSVCGCSCEAVLFSAPDQVKCDESCPNKNVCDNHTVICELSTHRCGAIPKAP